MPDPTIEREVTPIPADRPAVNEMAGHHLFVPSEFAPESGRCDICGGGEQVAIHQKPVDQMSRIADALTETVPLHIDSLDGTLATIVVTADRIAGALEEIAGALHRIEDRFREATEDDTTDAYRKFMQERGL